MLYLNNQQWHIVCGADRVVGDSSYCNVMQFVASCRRSIVQWENNGDQTTLKIVQCELGLSGLHVDTTWIDPAHSKSFNLVNKKCLSKVHNKSSVKKLLDHPYTLSIF